MKSPKLAKNDVTVIVDLKGHGMWIEMVDKAWLKKLEDQDTGEGPLILTSVGAYLQRRKSRDLYKAVPRYALAAGIAQADVRNTLGSPDSIGDNFDRWLRDGLKFTAAYTEDLKLAHVVFDLPR